MAETTQVKSLGRGKKKEGKIAWKRLRIIDVKSLGRGKKKGKIARKRQKTTKKTRDYDSDEDIVDKSEAGPSENEELSAQNAQKDLIPAIKQSRKEAVFVRSLCLSNTTQRCFSKISASPDETFSVDDVYEPPFPNRKHKIAGYCKGLYCLEYENGTTLLWDPSKKEYKFLPPSELKTPRCHSPTCTVIDCSILTASAVRGLGFDPISRDYKVIRCASSFYRHSRDCFSTKQVEVYSLVANCWKEIDAEGEQYSMLGECATSVDGICYWLGHNSCSDVIISLDLSSDEFSTLPLPDGLIPFFSTGSLLTKFHTSLCFIRYTRREPKENDPKTMLCWVRGVDGWIKEMDFDFRGAERPLGFCGNSLMFEGLDCCLRIYDSEHKLFRKIAGVGDYPHCMLLSSFAKSYVSLR